MRLTSRSSRRRSSRGPSSKNVETRALTVGSQPLGDETSGAGNPSNSYARGCWPAEVKGPVAYQPSLGLSNFGVEGFEEFRMDRRRITAQEQINFNLFFAYLTEAYKNLLFTPSWFTMEWILNLLVGRLALKTKSSCNSNSSSYLSHCPINKIAQLRLQKYAQR